MNKTDFTILAEKRYSVRKFSDEAISDEIINAILYAGHIAPTACNKQPQRIYVMKSKEALTTLKKCTRSHFDCPLAFLVCYDDDKCYVRDYDNKKSGEIDASIVTTHMMLEATALNIGTTWIMHFIPEAIICEYNLPSNIIPVALLVCGYPSSDAKPSLAHSTFKDMKDIVTIL